MILDKLQGKVVTHSEEVEWWIILMECVNSSAILVNWHILTKLEISTIQLELTP